MKEKVLAPAREQRLIAVENLRADHAWTGFVWQSRKEWRALRGTEAYEESTKYWHILTTQASNTEL
jgi:hypothetical protein